MHIHKHAHPVTKSLLIWHSVNPATKQLNYACILDSYLLPICTCLELLLAPTAITQTQKKSNHVLSLRTDTQLRFTLHFTPLHVNVRDANLELWWSDASVKQTTVMGTNGYLYLSELKCFMHVLVILILPLLNKITNPQIHNYTLWLTTLL